MREIGTDQLLEGSAGLDCFAQGRCAPKIVVNEFGSFQGVEAGRTLIAVGTQGVEPGGGIGASLGCKPSKNQISFFFSEKNMYGTP